MRTPKVEAIQKDPRASYWLKDALRQAVQRSPVDALEDAQRLAEALEEWCDAKLKDEMDKRLRMRGKAPEAVADEMG